MQKLFLETNKVGKKSYFKAFLEKGGFLMLKKAGKLLWYLLLGAAGPAEARYFQIKASWEISLLIVVVIENNINSCYSIL